MIIVKCEKCGELLHQADRCFACGNTVGFAKIEETNTIHENVNEEYSKIEILVKTEKFDDALEMSRKVLEWMPFCSDVFWLRLLAKKRCTSDEMLIRKGVSCEESAEFYNAVRFASEAQKKVYMGIESKILEVKKILKDFVIEHKYSEKGNTDILQHQLDMPAEIETYRKKLHSLWEELKEVEHDILTIEEDCSLLVHEHIESLNLANSEAVNIKNKTYKIEQCTAEELHKYQTQFGNLLHQSEQAKASIDSIRKQHPWIETYNSKVKIRNEIVSKINNEINELRNYERKVQSTVSKIEQIDAEHASALASVEAYDFTKVRNILGENRFMSAFLEAGVK